MSNHRFEPHVPDTAAAGRYNHSAKREMEPDLAKRLSYDPLTGVLRWADKRSRKLGRVAGVRSAAGYVRVQHRGKFFEAHRLVWLIAYGMAPNGFVDHANGDKADNRLSNLRLADRLQNFANSKVRKDSSSGITGVRWLARRSKWVATICSKGRARHLGLFANKFEAKAAYDAAKTAFYGEFAPQ